MRWSLVAVRICMVIVSIAIAALILLTTVPLGLGGMDFDLPDENDDVWSVEGNTYSAELPVSIYNGGYFDIEDFNLEFNLTDTDGYPLAQSTNEPVDLKAGEWTDFVVAVSFDLDSLPMEKQYELVFNGTEATIALGLDATFGLGTMKLSLDIDPDDSTIEIPAMIEEMSVDPSMMSLVNTGTGYEIQFPYSFSSSDWLSGEQLDLDIALRNATGPIGTAQENIMLGGYNSGTLVFPISDEMYAHLMIEGDTITVDSTISFMGFTLENETAYEWPPAIGDITIVSLDVIPYSQNAYISYVFESSPLVQGRYVDVSIVVTDGSDLVATGMDSFTLYSINNRYAYLNIDDEAVNWIPYSPGEWTVTFTFTGSGFSTVVTETYQWNGGA